MDERLLPGLRAVLLVGAGGSNPRPAPCKGGTKLQVREFLALTRCALEYLSVLLSTFALLLELFRNHRGSAGHAIQVPLIGDALEFMLADVLESDT